MAIAKPSELHMTCWVVNLIPEKNYEANLILECFLFGIKLRGFEQQILEQGTLYGQSEPEMRVRGCLYSPHGVQDLSFSS